MRNIIAKEVKEEILSKVKLGEKVADLSGKYGISVKTIYTWLEKGVTRKVSFLEYSKLRKENQVLKEIIGVLTVELEKTKKKNRSIPTHI